MFVESGDESLSPFRFASVFVVYSECVHLDLTVVAGEQLTAGVRDWNAIMALHTGLAREKAVAARWAAIRVKNVYEVASAESPKLGEELEDEARARQKMEPREESEAWKDMMDRRIGLTDFNSVRLQLDGKILGRG